MWTKSENSNSLKPEQIEFSGEYVIVRKDFAVVEATEDYPEHWQYDEWQMTKEQYEVYEIISIQGDAITELTEKVDGELAEATDIINVMTGGEE